MSSRQILFQHVLFLSSSQNQSISLGEGFETLLQSYGNELIDVLNPNDDFIAALSIDPHVAHQKHLWQPWHIYSDTQSAFMVGLEPRLPDISKHVAHTPSEALSIQILVVPSWLYTKGDPVVSPKRFRVAVKYAFGIKSIKPSLCNKAYFHLYPENVRTASAVACLVSKGAIVVSKRRLTSFVFEDDLAEAVDQSAPFYPRGKDTKALQEATVIVLRP